MTSPTTNDEVLIQLKEGDAVHEPWGVHGFGPKFSAAMEVAQEVVVEPGDSQQVCELRDIL